MSANGAATGSRPDARPGLLAGVAAFGLPTPPGGEPPPALDSPLDGNEWGELLSEARRQRMLGLLIAAARHGAFPTTEAQYEETYGESVTALCGDLIRERELLTLVELLTRGGFDHRVLKGAAVAHLDYPDPTLRSFADVDLLVRSEHWDDVIRVLQHAGWQREFAEPRPGFERRFLKSMLLTRPDGTTELDLHRTLALGPFGLSIRLGDLWEHHEAFSLVDGQELRALDPEARFLHACLHAVLGDLPPRLVPLHDVAQMALSGTVEIERAVQLARAWRAEAVLSRAVATAWETLGLEGRIPVPDSLAGLAVPRRQLRELGTYLSPRRSYVALTVAAVRAVHGPLDEARYLLALGFPEREFVSPRYAGRSARWRSAARVLLDGHGHPALARRAGGG